MVEKSDIFMKALFIAFVLFSGLLVIALFFELQRLNSAYEKYSATDLSWQDLRIRDYYLRNLGSEFCQDAVKSNEEFADRIYKDGVTMQHYENANRMTSSIINEKKKYVLLQLEFWQNLEDIKKQCNASYSTITYFYSQYPNMNQKAVQNTFSDLLVQLKRDYPEKVMLIPLAGDIGLNSVDFAKSIYDVNELPTLIINSREKIEGLISIEELRKKVLM